MKYDQKGIEKTIKKYLKIDTSHIFVPKSYIVLIFKCLKGSDDQIKVLRKTVGFSFFLCVNWTWHNFEKKQKAFGPRRPSKN